MNLTLRMTTAAILFSFPTAVTSMAAAPVRVTSSVENEKAAMNVTASGLSGAAINLNIPAVGIADVQIEGNSYKEVSLPTGDYLTQGELAIDGAPDIPTLTTLMAVPDQAGINFTVEYSDFDIIDNIDLAPTQPSPLESGEGGAPFTIDQAIYSKDQFYPGNLADVSDPVIMRDVRFVQVTTFPVQYNPVRRQLKVYRDLNVSLSFDGQNVVNPKTTHFRYMSEGFYPIYRALIANFDQFFSTTEVRRGGYLILANDVYVDTLKALADWKHRKGYYVHIAPSSEIRPSGGTPTQSDIYNYILNAYNSWEIPPEFVMIVGDESGSYSLPDWPYSIYASDHHYSMLEGGPYDYLPDIFVSRLSVSSMSDLRVALKKILDYETSPYMEDIGYWHRGLSVAGNVFATTPRTTVLWVRQFLMQNGFTSVDTSFLWYGVDGHGDFNPGPGDILESMTNGVAYVSYRGWAGPSGWYNPSFSTSNLAQVPSNDMIGVMASIVCGTGDFGSGACFGEVWIRMGTTTHTKGGPAFFGCTDHSTHTRWNNPIMTGFYWGLFTEGIYHFAAAAVRGKIQQYNTFTRFDGWNGQIMQYFHTYNMLGDPELEMRTTAPILINVLHPLTLNLGEDFVDIQVSDDLEHPVTGAYVTLLKMDGDTEEVYEVSRTDESGSVSIPFDAATGGFMSLTVSGPNLYPYQALINIVEGGLVVARDSVSIDDDNTGYSSGNGDGQADPGETIELSVSLKNFSADQTANGIRAELVPMDDDMVTLLVADQYYGDIAPGQSVRSEFPFVIRVSPRADDDSDIRLKLFASNDRDTWQSVVQIPVDAPKLIVSNVSFPGGNGRLDPGEQLDMVLTLRNIGSADANGVTATVSTMDDYTTVISGAGQFGDIPADGTGSNSETPMVVMADPETFDGRTVNLALHTITSSGAESMIPFTVTVGSVSSTDPVGPDAYGYYMFDNTDVGYAPVPAYNWVGIAPNEGGQGTRVNFGSNTDDNTIIMRLPFEFLYYGESYLDIAVCTNGFIALDTSSYDEGGTHWSNFFNWPIPDPGNGRGQISPFWDDLGYTGGTYGVYTWYDADSHRFIIEWYHLSHRNTGSIETFEMIITDPAYHPTLTGDSEIYYQYNTIFNNDSENYSSVGFESFDETRGLEYTYDNGYTPGAATLGNNRAIRITTNTGRGAIGGNVNLSNFGFNQGVKVLASSGQYRITPQSGDYWIREVPPGTINVTATGEGYFPMTVTDVTVNADQTAADVDFVPDQCPVAENLAASEGLGDRIEVTWDAVDHPDLVGYNVFRSAWQNGVYEMLNTDPVSGESFTDTDVPDNNVYWYYVTAMFTGDYGDAESFASNIDYGSLEEVTGVEDNQPSVPDQFYLSQNYPNPFNPTTTISYGLPADSDVRIMIFNVLGQRVRTLVDERQAAGYKAVVWDGHDNSGNSVSSGVYFYTIEAGSYSSSKKMLLLK